MQGNTNGPSGIDNLYGQSYSWYIGIGNNYPASGANSYGAQFALARNTSYPVLSIRFKENNSWGGWTVLLLHELNLKLTFRIIQVKIIKEFIMEMLEHLIIKDTEMRVIMI